jgi:predicted aldo/keto reductase-like oxidoreductase
MVCFSFLEPAAEEKVIPKAREKQMGIIAMKPLSGGVIRAKEAAFKWVFSHPDILVLAGVEEKSYIDQNWKIFQNGHALTDEDMREIREIRKELDRKFCRRCDYCLPCTAEIPIQFALGVRSMVKRMGPGILQQPMFKDIREKALNCTECGDCMERCPYDLPIPDMIKENLKWLDEVMSEAGLDTLP